MLPRITDGIKHLIILNVLVYIGANSLRNFGIHPEMLYLHFPGTEHFRIWQFVTHFFMHANLNHLFFNMLTLYFIGGRVEIHFGTKRFIKFFLLTGLLASILNLLVTTVSIFYLNGALGGYGPVVGASGAIYAVMVAFAVLYPDVKLMLLFPPIPISAKYLVGGLIALDLYSGFSGANTGIAHFAHLGGALAGFILTNLYRRGRMGNWF